MLSTLRGSNLLHQHKCTLPCTEIYSSSPRPKSTCTLFFPKQYSNKNLPYSSVNDYIPRHGGSGVRHFCQKVKRGTANNNAAVLDAVEQGGAGQPDETAGAGGVGLEESR